MMEWIQSFLKKFGRLNQSHESWKLMPSHAGFSVPTKAYRELTQWPGKEMHNLGRIVFEAIAAAPRDPLKNIKQSSRRH
jgi:hypothetical protein